MDYRVVVTKGKIKETLYITECSCASEAERKALQRRPNFSIYDIARCGEGDSYAKYTSQKKSAEDDLAYAN